VGGSTASRIVPGGRRNRRQARLYHHRAGSLLPPSPGDVILRTPHCRSWPLLALLCCLPVPFRPAAAQEIPPLAGTEGVSRCVAAVPFGVGEVMDYQVKLGRLSVGDASVRVAGVETVRGHRTYRLDWRVEGGIPLARVNDRYQSWMDVETLASRRFIQDISQVRRQRLRHFEIYPEERRYEWVNEEQEFELLSDRPLDDISFVFYVRTLDLVVGETVTMNRYFREHGNPVVLEVLREERIEVPAGTFDAVVVRPIVQSRGLWDEGGEAEVFISRDSDRLLLKVTSRVPLVGSLSLHLRGVRKGLPLVGTC